MIAILNAAGWILLIVSVVLMLTKYREYFVYPWGAGVVSWGTMQMMLGNVGMSAFWFIVLGIFVTINIFTKRFRKKQQEQYEQLMESIKELDKRIEEENKLEEFIDRHPKLSEEKKDLQSEAALLNRRIATFREKAKAVKYSAESKKDKQHGQQRQ